jgi:uncharacterized membrane protein
MIDPMPPAIPFSPSLSHSWEVLMLFLIPIGGGIPAGVLLGKSRGLNWPVMTILYFISDVILACVFEPLMWGVIKLGKRQAFLTRFIEAMRESTRRTTARFGTHLGPLALIMVAFGVDPMTGRSAAAAAGHGFVSGWALAIAGDMLYYLVIMVSTLWLQEYLGDGTWTMIIIMVLMMVVPGVIRRIRARVKTE